MKSASWDGHLHQEHAAPGDEASATALRWQDDAEDAEWNAWMEDTGSASTGAPDDDDEDFGAWVDASDSNSSTTYHTPISTPKVDVALTQVAETVTTQESRQLRCLEYRQCESTIRLEQTPTILKDNSPGLDYNPWHVNETGTLPSSYTDQCDYDIDPEIDSALAFSAWESILVTEESVRDECVEEEAPFTPWVDHEQGGFGEIGQADAECDTRFKRGVVNLPNRSQRGTASRERSSQLHSIDDQSMMKNTMNGHPTWVQRLTGNARYKR